MINTLQGRISQARGKPRVYLAGKIWKNDWRATIFPGISWVPAEEWPVPHQPVVTPDWECVGPFFMSCDHGCYHGPNTHGVGDGNQMCTGQSWDPSPDDDGRRSAVLAHCLGAIQRCDVVFAWVTRPDIYGSLVELGYARALHRPICIAFPPGGYSEDLWFAMQTADHCIYQAQSIEAAWENFTQWWKKDGHDEQTLWRIEETTHAISLGHGQTTAAEQQCRNQLATAETSITAAISSFQQIARWSSDPRVREEAQRMLRQLLAK